jgi:hypothetical protein
MEEHNDRQTFTPIWGPKLACECHGNAIGGVSTQELLGGQRERLHLNLLVMQKILLPGFNGNR